MSDAESKLRSYLEWVEAQLQSAEKFKAALESLGYECPVKWSEKQACYIPALAKNDDQMRELLEHDDSRVQALAAARIGVKSTIDETRAERLIQTSGRGALPVYLSYAAAKTLRFGGGDKTNWQNLRRGGEIRKSIVAPQGYKLVIGDLSQIEYRLLCWLTGQHDKLEALVAGRDLYCEYASQFYGETITKDDKPRRGVGKQGILMGGYGAGEDTMIRTAAGGGYGPPIKMSDAEGQRMVALYRAGHPRVEQFWQWCERAIHVMGQHGAFAYNSGPLSTQDVIHIENQKIWLPNDTWIDYTGMRYGYNRDIFPNQKWDGKEASWWDQTKHGWSRMWGSKLTADIIQSLARVIIVSCLVKLKSSYRIALQVHDELLAVVPDAQADEASSRMKHIMKMPPTWCNALPLDAEVVVSDRYDK